MSILAQLAAVIGVVIASAVTRITGTVAGLHFSVPPIGLLLVALILALAALVLYLIRLMTREGFRSSPYLRTVAT
jgi:hypothetical protein